MAAKKNEAKAASTPEEKAAAAPKAPKDTQNGITRPKAGTQTGRVWEIADALSAQTGEPATRKAVLEQFVGEDGNVATGATQYGRWRKYHGLAGNGDGKPGRPKKEAAAPAEAPAETQAEMPLQEAPTADEDTGVEDEV